MRRRPIDDFQKTPDNAPPKKGRAPCSLKYGIQDAIQMKNKAYFLAVAVLLMGCAAAGPETNRVTGLEVELGGGLVSTFATLNDLGEPLEFGVSISSGALLSPPIEHTDGLRCFDRNEDGAIDDSLECDPSHERVIPLPEVLAKRSDVPFKWVLFHWNPMGHEPHGIYSVPHFDVHYMIDPVERVISIPAGTCGEGVRCDAYERAKEPLPEGFMHPDYQDVDAVVPAMGNHLIDVTAHEFHGSPFTRSWIYGTYDGRVTFYEEMVAKDFLLSKPDECFAIKSPPKVEMSGFYPTRSCIRYDPESDAYTVSVDQFQRREGTKPIRVRTL